MERISTSTKKSNLFGTGKHGYTDGSPGVEAATVLDSAAMNALQEEPANLLELFFGVALIPGTRNQLATAFTAWRKQIKATRDYTCAANPRTITSLSYAPTAIASGGTVVGPLHVVVGANGWWQVSKDKAQSWSSAAQAGTTTFNAVIFDAVNSVFTAAGASQVVYTSNNTVASWTADTIAGAFTGTWYDLAYFSSLVVMCGTSGSGAGEIQTKSAGTWTSRTLPVGTTALRQFATDGTTLICVGAASGDGRIVKSTNGTTWSTAATITGAGVLKYAAYSATQALWYVASDTDIWTSPNLTNWTHVSLVLDSGHAYTGIVALEQAVACFHTHASLVSQGAQMKFTPDGANYYAAAAFPGAAFHTRPTKIYQCYPGANSDVPKHFAIWAATPFSTLHTVSQWYAPNGLV
jgi:hypothetical protein